MAATRNGSSGVVSFGSPPGVDLRDFVHLNVKVNEDHCKAPRDLKKMHDRWVKVSTHTIVAHAASHFLDAPVHPNAPSPEAARLQQVWGALAHFYPRGESDGNRKRLVITPGANSDARSYATQLLGVGMGLAVICKCLAVPLATLSRRNFSPKVFHDYEAIRNGKPVFLEVRGRYQGNGRATALTQVDKKFRQYRDFSAAIAAQAYTDSRPNRDRCDVELVDPPGDSGNEGAFSLERAIARHYADYLLRQHVHGGVLLAMLAEVPDAQFASFHRNTFKWIWREVLDRELARPMRLGRVRIEVGGMRYYGSMWSGWAAPSWVKAAVPGAAGGYLFMGLPETVFSALGRLETISGLASPGDDRSTQAEGMVYLQLSDGFLVVWSPTKEGLIDHA